jgi:hypothetical protein
MRRARGEDGTAEALGWLGDHERVRAHFRDLGVAERLSKNKGGFVRIEGLLPPLVADVCLDLLTQHEQWEEMNDAELADEADDGQVVQHSFLFSDPHLAGNTGNVSTRAVSLLTNALALMFEELVPSFSVSCYRQGDCIGPHDDKAHVYTKPAGGGRVQLHSRKIAAVLHLSKGWKPSFGGAFVDLEGQREFFPKFNTLLLFRVPRMHFVGPVLSARQRRYSVFGWWLAPGKLYDLDGAAEEEEAPHEAHDGPAEGGKRARASSRRPPAEAQRKPKRQRRA